MSAIRAFAVMAVVVCTGALASAPATAQVVRGTVVEAEDGTPIPGATVLLLRSNNRIAERVVTDNAGAFRVKTWPRGTYSIAVRRLDHVVIAPQRIELVRDDTFTVRIEVPREVVRLPALDVVASSRSRKLEQVGFYERSLSTQGRFMGPGRIMRRNWINTTALVGHFFNLSFAEGPFMRHRHPNDELAAEAGSCTPQLFIDGMPYGTAEPVVLDMISASEVEGIEYYRESWAIPPQYSSWHRCGALLLWSKA